MTQHEHPGYGLSCFQGYVIRQDQPVFVQRKSTPEAPDAGSFFIGRRQIQAESVLRCLSIPGGIFRPFFFFKAADQRKVMIRRPNV